MFLTIRQTNQISRIFTPFLVLLSLPSSAVSRFLPGEKCWYVVSFRSSLMCSPPAPELMALWTVVWILLWLLPELWLQVCKHRCGRMGRNYYRGSSSSSSRLGRKLTSSVSEGLLVGKGDRLVNEKSILGPTRWLCNGNAPLKKAFTLWGLFIWIFLKLLQLHGHWYNQPLFYSVLSFPVFLLSLLSLLENERFVFPSGPCQVLPWCLLTHLLSTKTLESAHILKKEDHPRLSSAESPETGLRRTRKDIHAKEHAGTTMLLENKSYLTLQPVCSPVLPAAHSELPVMATNSSLEIWQEICPAYILCQD